MNPAGRNRAARLTCSALCAALMAVCAWVSLPGAVPVTMQSFALFLILLLFGGKTATASVSVYLLLGIVGLPVFAGMQGGIGVLFGPHGGFLMGFLLMTLVDWGIGRLWRNRNTGQQLVCIAAELLLCYGTGTAWYMLVNGEQSAAAAVGLCVLPFLLPDGIKLMLAALLNRPIGKRLSKSAE